MSFIFTSFPMRCLCVVFSVRLHLRIGKPLLSVRKETSPPSLPPELRPHLQEAWSPKLVCLCRSSLCSNLRIFYWPLSSLNLSTLQFAALPIFWILVWTLEFPSDALCRFQLVLKFSLFSFRFSSRLMYESNKPSIRVCCWSVSLVVRLFVCLFCLSFNYLTLPPGTCCGFSWKFGCCVW